MILVLATLAVLILPRLGDDQKSVRSADQISMWLLISKQRAYRDQAPRGVRLVRSVDDPNFVKELVYIEQPEDLVGTALYLLSDLSTFVTGQTILVNGGAVLH